MFWQSMEEKYEAMSQRGWDVDEARHKNRHDDEYDAASDFPDEWIDELPRTDEPEYEPGPFTLEERKSIGGSSFFAIERERSDARRRGMSREELDRRVASRPMRRGNAANED